MNHRIIVIAEAGVNHNGSLSLAKQLIDAAAAAEVDYVKFQTFKTENLVTLNAEKAEYQQRNTGETESQFSMLKKLELSKKNHEELIDYCRIRNVKFFSTAFDLESLDYLHSLNLGLWKIPSGELTNYPYLKKIAGFGEPVILSTGMSELEEVREALQVLLSNGLKREHITLLHCTTEYPTPWTDVNLRAMQTLQDTFGVNVGYSDHTEGIEVPIAAAALGAKVIEKHFTVDRNLPGPDHKASLEPAELKAMVTAVRHIEESLGDGRKIIAESERKNRDIARKSIIAARDIAQGEVLRETDLIVMRPGTGISPMRWNEVIGRIAIRDFRKGDCIEL